MINTDVSLGIGSQAPDFRDLLGVDGRRYSLSSFDSDPLLVVMFLSNVCPTVKGYEGRLREIDERYGPRGVRVVAINANNPFVSPRDSHAEMVTRAAEAGYGFPYLKDDDRSVARAFDAICTPHVFVFDEERRLRYRGRIDDSRLPDSVTTRDLQDALDDLLDGRPVRVAETEPFGCGLVW